LETQSLGRSGISFLASLLAIERHASWSRRSCYDNIIYTQQLHTADSGGLWPTPGGKIIVMATMEWEDIEWMFNELPE
jgi:hypothetical protein